MANTRNEIVRAVETSLREDGWRKSGASWYKDGEDVLLAVDLQKSNHSSRYYLNLGIFIHPVQGARPRVELAPIGLRVGDLPGAKQYDSRNLLDLNSASVGVDRGEKIERMMHELVLPALNACRSVADLKTGGAGRTIIDSVPALGNDAVFLRYE